MATSVHWLNLDDTPPGSDESFFYYSSLEYKEILFTSNRGMDDFFDVNDLRPPLELLIGSMFFLVHAQNRRQHGPILPEDQSLRKE